MEKYNDARGFRNIRMNLDAAPEALEANEYREIFNMIEENTSGKLVNMKGFESVMALAINSSFSLPAGTFKCIGSRRDIEENTIIYCLCDTAGTNHSILQMNTETKVLEWILKSERYLNFKSDHRVSVKVIEGLLYLTDGYFGSFLGNDFNPPRKINIEKAKKFTTAFFGTQVQYINGIGKATVWPFNAPLFISSDGNPHTTYRLTSQEYKYTVGDKVVTWIEEGDAWGYRYRPATGYGTVIERFIHQGIYYLVIDRAWTETVNSIQKTGHILPYSADMYFGIDWQVLDVIKWKPKFAPSVSYGTDLTHPENRLQNKLFQFCYRWVFDDKEKSVCSPISDVPLPDKSELITGVYDLTIHDNFINIWVDTGSMEVEKVEILMREGNIGNWKIINRKYKYDQDSNCILSNDIYNPYAFHNNESGEAVDQADIARPYDFVPITAKRQEIIEKNRLLYGDYREGFDIVDVDVELSSYQIEREFITGYNIPFTEFTWPSTPPVGFPGNYVYSKGVEWYMDSLVYKSKFFGGVRIGFSNIILLPFATYFFTIDTDNFYSYTKTPSEELETWWNYPAINNTDFVGGTAVVTLGELPTLKDLLNYICEALRNFGYSGNLSAIACTGHEPYMNWNNHLWDTFEHQSNNLQIASDEIFIVLGGGQGNATVDLDKITVTLDIYTNSATKGRTFKGGETKEVGLEYSDRAGRSTFINSDENCKVYIPSQVEITPTHIIHQNIIQWGISHVPPMEAVYYRWVMRRRVSMPYYIQCPLYGIDRSTTGTVLIFTSLSVFQNFTTTKKFFNKFNVSAYTWEPGDRLRFLMNSVDGADGENVYMTFGVDLDFEIMSVEIPSGTLTYLYDDDGDPILDAQGNKIKDSAQSKLIISYFDFSTYGISNDTLLNQKVIIEIYRPGKHIESDVYYQLSKSLPILNPHTANRVHSGGPSDFISGWDRDQVGSLSARGTLESGDAYLISRLMQNDLFSTVFPCESMSYSDWYNSDVISIGLKNIENKDAYFNEYISNLRYGGRLIQDTRINDMARFMGDDFVPLSNKYGPITSIEEVGFTLKILQKSKSSSLYIGRAGVTQPSEQSTEILTSTKDVLGTLIVHPSDFGTVHPDSYVKNENRGYFFDFYAYALCRDANNGIQNISEAYNINAFLKEKCRLFGSADNVDVVGAYDQANELVFWSFTDKTTAANSFTIAFRDTGGRNQDGFALFAHFLPDYYGVAKQTLTSFKGNTLWLHNSDTAPRVNFYGIQYKYWFTMVFNKLPLIIKRILTIFVASDKKFSAPNAGDISIPPTGNNPNGMVSLLKSGAFDSVQGKWIAEFGKNMTTNQATASIEDLVNGDDLEGQTIEVRLEGDETIEHEVFSVEIEGVTTKP